MKKKTIITLLFTIVLSSLILTILSVYGGGDTLSKKEFKDFSKIIDEDNLKLKIYYIDPLILTRSPLNIDGLMNHSAVNQIDIDNNSLKKHIDSLNQMNADIMIPVKNESSLNARLYYVFETDSDGKILDIAMWGNDNSIFVNGLEVEENDIFYEVIIPFLPENMKIELKNYLGKGD